MTEAGKISRIELIVLSTLLLILLGSAIAVIYYKNMSRSIFIEIERNEQALDNYEVQWKQLKLEVSTLSEQNQVEGQAKERLKLVVPQRDKTVYLKP